MVFIAEYNLSNHLSLFKERKINVDKNVPYYAKKAAVKTKHPLNNTYAKFLPECATTARRKGSGVYFNWSAEDAVLDVLAKDYERRDTGVRIFTDIRLFYDDIKYTPDAVILNAACSRKAKYIIEVKTTMRPEKGNRSPSKKYCILKIGALQALRNASALVKAGVVDEVLPKVVYAEFIPVKYDPARRMMRIVLMNPEVYSVGLDDVFKVDRELADIIYGILGGDRDDLLTR
ncbi:hypothetical protein [Stygiolobus caldivivus]|uniref:Uncharacterized protein n=1 Tax=Stygiolobus caldivivus TaxID=2824673 RepID=A0A8D5ZF99_9CREN|nr:hypothetical protein [Stygiolobus caldivivus]BCU70138.1 hypothetical protein KN1_14350 [Stygiolobus caldivivus]